MSVAQESPPERIVFRTCPLCEATCGLQLRLSGDTVLDVRGDRKDPFSGGFICPKGAALGALHADPDRLTAPLVRRDGVLQTATWQEAFEAVEIGLKRVWANDRTALAAYLGNPTIHNLAGTLYAKPLILGLKTHQIYSASTVDQMPKHVSSGWMYGNPLLIPVPDLDRTDWLLMLGANPRVSNGSLCTAPDFPGRLRAISKRGGRVIVVDPRRSETAAKADEHVSIVPGGDVFLLLAMAHVLFDQEHVSLGRLAAHTQGLDTLKALVQPWTPERAAPLSGISSDVIERLAQDFAAAEKPAIYGRMGTCTQRHGTLVSWLVDALMVLRGRLDEPGGAMFPTSAHSTYRPGRPAGGRGWGMGRWRSRVRKLPEVRGEMPVATLADEILTPGKGQVRGLLTIAGNPALSTPDSDRMMEALGSLDFMVSVDPYLNETTRFADVILPPPSPLARPTYHLAFYDLAVRNVAHYAAPAVGLKPGQMSEAEILLRLTGIASGLSAGDVDPWAVDQKIAVAAIRQELRSVESPIAGRNVDEILQALGDRRGPTRLLDLKLRCGPYGDHFGARNGGDDAAPQESLTLDRLAAVPHGLDFGPLVPRLPGALRTASAAIELSPAACVAAVEALDEETANPGKAPAPGEFLLIGRRTLRTNNSWMHNLPAMVAGKPRCTLQMHPEDAAAMGLTDAQTVRVTSVAGSVDAALECTRDLRQGVVSLPHGWGHGLEGSQMHVAAQHAGVGSNALTDSFQVDPLSGNAVLNGIPVTVVAADQV